VAWAEEGRRGRIGGGTYYGAKATYFAGEEKKRLSLIKMYKFWNFCTI
jgi:hypothetical protein